MDPCVCSDSAGRDLRRGEHGGAGVRRQRRPVRYAVLLREGSPPDGSRWNQPLCSPVGSKPRAAACARLRLLAAGLGMLCVLLMSAVIVLCIGSK